MIVLSLNEDGISQVLVLLFILIIIYSFVSKKLIIGRHIYALGGNEKAAELSGINTKKLKLIVFINMGFLAALSAIVLSGRMNSAQPAMAEGFELDAIAACFIGGASASGGVGTIFGVILGGLFIGVINIGMSMMGLGTDVQKTIKGAVLLLDVIFDLYSKSKMVKKTA